MRHLIAALARLTAACPLCFAPIPADRVMCTGCAAR